jgi:serine O-acetyltransferase
MKKVELDEILREEKLLYLGENENRINQMRKSCNRRYVIWQYLVAFRKCQYWKVIRESGSGSGLERKLAKYFFRHYDKRRNRLSECCGVEIGINSKIGRGIDIWHGGIVINGNLGDFCILHGNNIIGNKGKGREMESPVIGDCVDIGAGANIIGGIKIADAVKIGAGALVIKSCEQSNSVLIGVPAKAIRIRGDL